MLSTPCVPSLSARFPCPFPSHRQRPTFSHFSSASASFPHNSSPPSSFHENIPRKGPPPPSPPSAITTRLIRPNGRPRALQGRRRPPPSRPSSPSHPLPKESCPGDALLIKQLSGLAFKAPEDAIKWSAEESGAQVEASQCILQRCRNPGSRVQGARTGWGGRGGWGGRKQRARRRVSRDGRIASAPCPAQLTHIRKGTRST